MSERERPKIPRATYRLQFRKEFGFDDSAALAPYLAALGISHVYASPYLKARPSSTHGYDIVDHNALNPELGTEAAFARMVEAFRANGLGQILDFVPNHMGVGGADNLWWLDVLEWGPDSEFAEWFDIEWQPERRYLEDKVLVPFLGVQYGAALEEGSLALKFDAASGAFAVWAYDTHKLPVSPLTYPDILGREHADLARIADAFTELPRAHRRLAPRAAELKAELAALVEADPSAATAIEAAVGEINGRAGDLASWARLDALIRKQHWRPAHFRVAADDINYRRFFNVNELAGIRMEIPEVFDHVHALAFRLLAEGVLDGLRLDHIDGLLDPKAYCLKLRERAPRTFYLLVEKILAAHESLRDDWGVEGTTGYEFANLLTGLLVDPAGEAGLSRAYAEFTGEERPFTEIVRESKLRIMENEMASELNVLAREAGRLARSHPRTADFTNNVLLRALKQVIACFPVYRTYVDGSAPSDADRRDIDWALAWARRQDTDVDPSVFDFLHRVLNGELLAPDSGFSHAAVTRLAMRLQQYSGPVMAKGLEDTAFYRYNRFLALNEVGGSPERFGVSLPQFHVANAQRAARTPHALLTTSTHDTKRGEDARARLAALSEMPQEWAERVTAWSRILRAREAGSEESAPPSRNDEYAFYQMLIGAWPPGLRAPLDPDALAAFRERMEGAVVKAMREAKVFTTWLAPNAEYENAVLDFVRRALDASRANPFLESFMDFVERVAPLGVWNSLAQTVLKLTVPGLPDIYQGAELWNFALVDPDNRRPVDFALRREMLERNDRAPGGSATDWRDGAVKLTMIRELLAFRKDEPELFEAGSYEPLTVEGPAADRICAFVRRGERAAVLVAVLRYPARGREGLPETTIAVPEELHERCWKDVLGGVGVRTGGNAIAAAEMFKDLPAAVFRAAP